jgi:hypothetical protein
MPCLIIGIKMLDGAKENLGIQGRFNENSMELL